MKKVLVLVALCFSAFTSVNAQYAPKKGDFALEFGFTPFSSDGEAFKPIDNMLKVRYLVSAKDGLRLKLGLGINNTSNTTTELQPSTEPYWTSIDKTTTTKNNRTDFSFMLGYERHLFTKGRFDVYAGIELGYGMTNLSGSIAEVKETLTKDEKGIIQGSEKIDNFTEYINQNTNGGATSQGYFQGNLFAGIDCYVWKGLYLGMECGLRFKTGSGSNAYMSYTYDTKRYKADNSIKYSKIEVYNGLTGDYKLTETGEGAGKPVDTKRTVSTNESGTTSFALFVEPAIRIGWNF